MRRRRMGRKGSKRLFRKTSLRTRRKNLHRVMRGGYRL